MAKMTPEEMQKVMAKLNDKEAKAKDRAVFDTRIMPLVRQLADVCSENDMSFFGTFVITRDMPISANDISIVESYGPTDNRNTTILNTCKEKNGEQIRLQ